MFLICLLVFSLDLLITIVTKKNGFFGTYTTYKETPVSFCIHVVFSVVMIVISVFSLFSET